MPSYGYLVLQLKKEPSTTYEKCDFASTQCSCACISPWSAASSPGRSGGHPFNSKLTSIPCSFLKRVLAS